MASLSSQIKIETELRPCKVKTKSGDINGLFHRWSDKSEIISPSMMKGGHGDGIVCGTVAIVEINDGNIVEFYPEKIQFIDGKFNEYCFGATKDSDKIKVEVK